MKQLTRPRRAGTPRRGRDSQRSQKRTVSEASGVFALNNGITILPGGFPLYRDGKVIEAIGISGDGVDQDDIIGISGTKFFRPDRAIRADSFTYRGARLPYVKFPRDPER